MRCSAEAAPVRAFPSDEGEQVTQALYEEPLRVHERREGWALVMTAYGYEGWIRESALEEGGGRLPQPNARHPLEIARAYLGAPYEWGGLTAAGIDCSGLVHISYRQTGRLVPRDAWQQEEAGTPVEPDHATPGDLITYGTGERADHIAFWVAPGTILHATGRESLGVVEETEPVALLETRRAVIRL